MRKTYSVQFDVSVPGDTTEAQVREWVRFNVGDGCDLPNTNPLSCTDLEPDPFTLVLRLQR